MQEEAVHDTKAHMADIDITNVIEYVQENRKEKYNTGFKIGIGCLVVSLVLFYCIYGRHIVFRETILGQ